MISLKSFRPRSYLLFFILLSVLLRIGSFFYSVIDHDESTYLIIADQMVQGKVLYTDVIDNKPPGIFLLVAFAQLLFGKSIFGLRLLAALLIGFSAYLIFRIRLRMEDSKPKALWSGILYVLLFGLYRTGFAANTELFFNTATLGALTILYPMLKGLKTTPLKLFLVGFIMGLGFIVKYFIIVDFAALMLLFLLFQHQQKVSLFSGTNIKALLISSLAFVLPFVMVNIVFFLTGYFEAYAHITYEVVFNYPSSSSSADRTGLLLNFHLRYLPIVGVFYFALFQLRKRALSTLFYFALTWYILIWSILLLSGKNFHHYYLQFMPIMALFLPEVIEHKMFQNAFWDKHKSTLQAAVLIILTAITFINQSYFWTKEDMPRILAEELRPEIEAGDLVWTMHRLQILSYLLDVPPSTPYVHPTIFFEHTESFMIDKNEELTKIFNRRPKFVIFKDEYPYVNYEQRLLEEYMPYTSFRNVQVWRRK